MAPRNATGEGSSGERDRESDPLVDGRPASLADLDALSEDVRVELIDGLLYELPVTTFEHGHIATSIVVALVPAYQMGRGGPGGWWIQGENDFVADGQVLRPDALGWRRARLPAPESASRVAIAPDWVLEVLSEGTRRHDLETKAAAYARLGVGHRWYVDPRDRTLRAYALVDGSYEEIGVFRDDAVVRVAPFEDAETAMGEFWAIRGRDR